MKTLEQILENEKKFRKDQVFLAWFSSAKCFNDVSSLPASLREELGSVPWITAEEIMLQKSKLDDSQKALLRLGDGNVIETVLMGRDPKGLKTERRYTICISSQVGCAMKCDFCATGKAGFKRNLDYREIIDQYRYWLAKGYEVDNIVMMGQGEPLLNYDNVKKALNILIKYGEVGHSKITISTCGIIPGMKKLLEDGDFPPVRFALSLHSAVEHSRLKLMPSHQRDFFDFLVTWSKEFHKKFASRSALLGLEYIMIEGVNDDDLHLKSLVKLASKLGKIRINLIPYNFTGSIYKGSPEKTVKHWHELLLKKGFIATIRKSQGQDIAAACGQLANNTN